MTEIYFLTRPGFEVRTELVRSMHKKSEGLVFHHTALGSS